MVLRRSEFLKSVLVLVGLSATGGMVRADLTTGLTAYWNFEGSFEATAGGSDFDGVPTGNVSFDNNTPFQAGFSARFDRQSGSHVFIDEQVIVQGQPHSYSLWYKSDVPNIVPPDRYFLLETTRWDYVSNDDGYSISCGLRDVSGTDILQTYTLSSTGTSTFVNVSGAADTGWHNVVVTYQSGQHLVYVDGVLRAQLPNTLPPLMDTGGLVIGAHRNGGRNWEGLIDDVAIWDRVLYPSEITEIQAGPILEDVVDQFAKPDLNDTAGEDFVGSTYVAQTFTAGRSEVLTAVDVFLLPCCSSSLPELTFEILDFSSGNLANSPEVFSTAVDPHDLDLGEENVRVDFPQSQLQLVEGQEYALVLRAPPSGIDYFTWLRSNTDIYSDGAAWKSTNSGTSWSTTGGDFGFATYLATCENVPEPIVSFVDVTEDGIGNPCVADIPLQDFIDIQDPDLTEDDYWVEIDSLPPYSGTLTTGIRVRTRCHTVEGSVQIEVTGCDDQYEVGDLIVYADLAQPLAGDALMLSGNVRIKDKVPSSSVPDLHFGPNSEAVIDPVAGTISDVEVDFPYFEIGSQIIYSLSMSNIVVDATLGNRTIEFDGAFVLSESMDPQNPDGITIGGPAHFELDYEAQTMSAEDGSFLQMAPGVSFLSDPLLIVTGTFNFNCRHFSFDILPPVDDTTIELGEYISLPMTTEEYASATLDLDDRAFWFRLSESAVDIGGSSGVLPFGCGSLGVCGGIYLRYDLSEDPQIGEIRIYDKLSIELPIPGDKVEAGLTVHGQSLSVQNCQEVFTPDPGGTWLTVTPGEIDLQGRISAEISVGNYVVIEVEEVDFSAALSTRTLDLSVSSSVSASIGPGGQPWFSLGFEGNSYLYLDWSNPYVISAGGQLQPQVLDALKLEATFDAVWGSEGFTVIEGELTADVAVTGLSFLDSLELGGDASFIIDSSGMQVSLGLDTPVFNADVSGRLGRDSFEGTLIGNLGYKKFTLLGGQGGFYLDPDELWVSAQATLFCIDIGTVALRFEAGDTVPSVDYKPRFALCSPLGLYFSNELGNVGRNPSTGEIEIGIPGAVYLEQGSAKYIELPSYDLVTLQSRVFMDGYDTGPYDFIATVPSQTGPDAVFLSYQGQLGVPETNLELVLDGFAPITDYQLSIDTDGDGLEDETAQPIEMTFEPIDPTIPHLTNVQVAQALGDGTAVTVTWESSAPMTSQVSYGADPTHGKLTPETTELVTQHAVTVNGLIPGSTTHLSAVSRTGSSSPIASHNLSFTTGLMDWDSDGHVDNRDNCPRNPNPSQSDSEGLGLRAGFEDGSFGGWSFATSSEGAQSGSNEAGAWAATLTNASLDGAFSARLWAQSDTQHYPEPWAVDAAIERAFPAARYFRAKLHFDDIQGSGGTGSSYLDFRLINVANPSEVYTYRFSTTGDFGGDVSVAVSPGDSYEILVDIPLAFGNKYGSSPTDVVARFRAHSDYAEGNSPGNRTRTTDLRVDAVQTHDALYEERWESGTTADWSYQYSTDGIAAGSNTAGSWTGEITMDAVEDLYSMQLSATSTDTQTPAPISSAIDHGVAGASRLLARLVFDEIGDFSSGGESYVEVRAYDTITPANSYSWHISDGIPQGGDEQILVSTGDELDLVLDVADAIEQKTGQLPSDVTVVFAARATAATDGPRTTRVRVDPIVLTDGALVPDGLGDECDANPNEWDPSQVHPTSVSSEDRPPSRYGLGGARPNPFNGRTEISYSVPRDGDHVTLRIYDIRGRLVRTLIDEAGHSGRWTVVWKGQDDRGRSVASGVYFYRLEAGSFESTRKMAHVK